MDWVRNGMDLGRNGMDQGRKGYIVIKFIVLRTVWVKHHVIIWKSTWKYMEVFYFLNVFLKGVWLSIYLPTHVMFWYFVLVVFYFLNVFLTVHFQIISYFSISRGLKFIFSS